MWFTDDEKLDIGRRVYTHEISKEQACKEYGISITTVVNYVKLYLKAHNIPAIPEVMNTKGVEIPNYQEMTKNELITELMKKDIEIARTKKGYNVKANYSDFKSNLIFSFKPRRKQPSKLAFYF